MFKPAKGGQIRIPSRTQESRYGSSVASAAVTGEDIVPFAIPLSISDLSFEYTGADVMIWRKIPRSAAEFESVPAELGLRRDQ